MTARRLPERSHDPPAGSRVLAEPGRDLLLRPAAQAANPDDYPDLDVLAATLTSFETRYNNADRPFDRRFGRDDLTQLLNRIAA
jgi:hypothetical protein